MRLEVSYSVFQSIAVSIHASVKDATDLEVASFNKQNVSIHASVKDATSNCDVRCSAAGFQSTHL